MYITLHLGNYTIHHGYEGNKEITEKVEVTGFTKKIVKIDRILSATENTILISSGFGREIYWEYEGGLDELKYRLRNAGLLVPEHNE